MILREGAKEDTVLVFGKKHNLSVTVMKIPGVGEDEINEDELMLTFH